MGQAAGLGIGIKLPKQTNFKVDSTAAYSPSYLYQLFPVGTPPALGEAIPTNPDYQIADHESYTYRTRAELSFGSRLGTMLTTSGEFNRTEFEQEVGEDGSRGAIPNIGSALAEAPEPRHFATHAYAASKGAVVAMSRSMASFYAPYRIRVNVLAPGLVRTPASERAGNEELLAFIRKKQPLADGMVDAEDVARAAVFLLGDGARSITGETITVDGGWSVTGV